MVGWRAAETPKVGIRPATPSHEHGHGLFCFCFVGCGLWAVCVCVGGGRGESETFRVYLADAVGQTEFRFNLSSFN